MGPSAVGAILLVRFPFSDLSDTKLRPAVALAQVDRDDWILCQVTSNPYSDPGAVTITEEDFISGGLLRTSFARPGKLFTANESLIRREVGILGAPKRTELLDAVVRLFRTGT